MKIVDLIQRETIVPQLKGSSKAAKAAKRIVGFSPEAPTDFATIYEQAIRGRLAADRRVARA